MQSIRKAKELLRSGVRVKYVANIVGLTPAICQQLKREIKVEINFGCVVCSSKEKATNMFCPKHYQKYISYPKVKKY